MTHIELSKSYLIKSRINETTKSNGAKGPANLRDESVEPYHKIGLKLSENGTLAQDYLQYMAVLTTDPFPEIILLTMYQLQRICSVNEHFAAQKN